MHDGHPGKVVFNRLCCAGHDFSVLATDGVLGGYHVGSLYTLRAS
jgi:hypothetical protein